MFLTLLIVRIVVLMELCNTKSNENFFRKNDVFSHILDIVNLKTDNNRLDIGGFSFNIDTIIILGILFFLVTDNSCDILLIICLGLSLLNINLNLFG